MKTVFFSALAVLFAGTALLSTACASPGGNIPPVQQGPCSPPCGAGWQCAANNQCVPAGTGTNSGNGSGSGGGSNQGTGGGINVGTGGGSGGGTGTGSGSGGNTGSGSGGNTGSGSGSGTGGNTGSGSGSGTGGNTGSGSGSGSGGKTTNYCGSCSSDADCGGGNNFCLAFSFGNYCGKDCSSGQSCPSGASCQQIGDGSGNVVGMNCVPNGTDCSGNKTGGGSTGSGGSGSGSGGSGSGSGSCTTDTWSNFGNSFFNNYCANCHGSMGSHSGVQSQLGSIASSIQGGSMPPGGLSSSMESRVIKYLNCGAP